MINLPGYFKRIRLLYRSYTLVSVTLLAILLTIPAFFYPAISSATTDSNAEGFAQSSVINYDVTSNGSLNVYILLTIIPNEGTSNVLKYFNVSLPFNNIEALEVRSDNTKFTTSKNNSSGLTKVTVNVNNLTINRDTGATFEISFRNPSYIKEGHSSDLPLKIGSADTQEVTVRLYSPFNTIAVPLLAGLTIKDEKSVKTLRIVQPKVQTISLTPVKSFLYSFKIKKTLVNSDTIGKKFHINIPKVDHDQQTIYKSISVQPRLVKKDLENNLVLEYLLKPQEEITVIIEGLVKLDELNEKSLEYEEFDKTTDKVGYWSLENETELRRIDLYIANAGLSTDFNRDARTLSPEDRKVLLRILYNYVLDRLGKSNELSTKSTYRQGAKVLENPSSASPSDYNDFLIAVYRAYAVPSRYVQGYVVNSSGIFNESFFHSWVEMWDTDSGWITADPSMQVLTGTDMFTPDFKDHIVFVTRSYNPFTPQMGFFLNEEIDVKLADEDFKEELSTNISQIINEVTVLQNNSEVVFTVENTGNTIINAIEFDFDSAIESNLTGLQEKLIFPSQVVELKGSIAIPAGKIADSSEPQSLSGSIIVFSESGEKMEYALKDQITIKHIWWWNTYIKLISILLFLTILLVSSTVFRGLSSIIRPKRKMLIAKQ